MRAVYEKRGFGQYAFDYIGHYTGMAVHDVGDRDQPFEPGVVFNVEPLLSLDDKQLHFRLEDTILVTEDGHENFTAKSPVALKEIYRLYDEPSRLIPEK
jgi:Xaa-Pro aminopeptidase